MERFRAIILVEILSFRVLSNLPHKPLQLSSIKQLVTFRQPLQRLVVTALVR